MNSLNLAHIKVGDKFSNETKLLTSVGFKKSTDGKTKGYRIIELQRYLSYEKTGKISRGNVTNEIVITEIFDTPKDKIDNRSHNGGNNTSIISDRIHDYIVNELEHSCIKGSKSLIIKQIGLLNDEFSTYYYNFDDYFVDDQNNPYTTVEKDFFFDYCDKIINSYKTRLKRVLDNFGDAINIEKFYQICILSQKNGKDYYSTEDIDKETSNKISVIKENLEFTYGVIESSDAWKIYGSKTTSKKFHDDFVGQVRTLLKEDNITNCYEILFITRNDKKELDYKCNYENGYFDYEKFSEVQSKFANNKIESVFNMTKSIYNSHNMEYENVPKYNREKISDEMIKDCIDMISIWGDINVDENTGEVLFNSDDIE